jgi:D-alanyl-D-alanine carboxypeptidase/D-alanyl-D-alanine-endopeptidase (penicillin-binding protein 4)
VGVHVVRLTDGAELYSRAADTLFVPASNVKILTTAAALRVLSPDYQFPTEVYGALKPSGQVVGSLVVKGYGDPYLVPERVWYLASRLYFLGVREILGDIVIDDAYFDGPRMGNGSEQDHSSNAYMAPAGAVSVGFNALMVHVLPGASVGDDARVMLEPLSGYATVQGQVRTVATGRSSISVEVVPQGGRSVVKLSGRIQQNDPGRGYWRRIDEPPLFAGEVLRSALGQVGVSVRGKVRRGALPPESPQLLSLTSPRLAELIGPLNKYSNNFMATQVAFAIGAKRFGAPGTWEKARQALDEFLTGEVGLAKGSYTLNNASGLHDVNRLTPRQMVQVLGYMYGQPQLYPEFIGSLAVAAGSGTLQDRMADTHAAHLLRAKTGTLSMASALSGYVTAKSGEPLAFSIIVNGYQSIEGVWAAQDRFGSALAGTHLSVREAGATLTNSEDDGLAAPDGARP